MTSIVVGTVDLRQALGSVIPHSDPDPERAQLHRVHCGIGPVNLTVTATQRITIGNAIVSIEDNAAGDQVEFDLLPQQVKEILALFKPPKIKGVDPREHLLRLDIDEKLVQVTDIAGLFAGKTLGLPRAAVDDEFPDVQKLLRTRLSAPAKATERLITSGDYLAMFTIAARTYHAPLVIEPTGSRSSMVISCGESFVGLLMPVALDETRTSEINGWHSDWLARLGDDAGYVPRGEERES